ncbi:unnamed protein product [Tilletia controversa]|nr:unnamed protein product [Tilletia controversa]
MVSAIGAWHKWHGHRWNFQPKSRLTLALRGAAAMTPASSRRPPREPYTTAYLRALRAHFNLSVPRDAAVWACALCAFWGLLRVGEAIVPTQKTYSPEMHISRSGWVHQQVPPHVHAAASASAALRLPWTKTTRAAGAVVVLTARMDDLCPVTAVLLHLAVSPLPAASPLFAFSRAGRSSPLSRSMFLARLKTAATAAGLPHLHGHSFRIGGCTELLLQGAAIEDVKAHGRWRSDAWTVYVRDHVTIFSSRLAPAPTVRRQLVG